MNRRAFFGGLATMGAASRATTAPMWPLWSGWRTPANQLVLIGFWSRPDPGDPSVYLYATTGGVVARFPALGVIDTSTSPGWPVVTLASTEAEKDDAKRRSYDALTEACG